MPTLQSATTVRGKLIIGNWKMNGDRARTASLCATIARRWRGNGDNDSVQIAVCPPAILIAHAAAALRGAPIAIGAQDVDANEDGAFTGQLSAAMLTDGGCRYVIVGHSERRVLYGETDAQTAHKAHAALRAGVCAVICVGETRDERNAGQTEQIIARQLDAVLSEVPAAQLANAVIAYEPVWAIGSGETATPEQAQQVHQFIRAQLRACDAQLADCRLLYGGSMKPDNAASLLAQADIDGGLIGGASLDAEAFIAICEAARDAARA